MICILCHQLVLCLNDKSERTHNYYLSQCSWQTCNIQFLNASHSVLFLENASICHLSMLWSFKVIIYRRFSRSMQLGGLRSVLDRRSHQGIRQSKLCYPLRIPPLVKERTLVRRSLTLFCIYNIFDQVVSP